ncbi:hypothetical protein [Polaromonas sp. JS666]|uniref:hypothetical protein n=1 Tax=Polaromonas sp. (strain JS666 / ATCC BAA-500) TaxID=296591 RepID=UPI000046439C|nr:hypothetical protein [Polaromonas sp. JS666]ABE46843.1 hypothetical protein Bpro_4971 [Polaromonas sp. JS666]
MNTSTDTTPAPTSEVEGLRAEVRRLEQLLQGKFNKETLLTSMEGNRLALQGGAASLLAEMFAAQFDGCTAENYLEVTFTSSQILPGERFVVTVQKCSGQTPHELRQAAEDRCTELARQVNLGKCIVREDMQTGMERTQELITIRDQTSKREIIVPLLMELDNEVFTTEQINDIGRHIRDNCGPATSSKVKALMGVPAFQYRVRPWLLECFGAAIAGDKTERSNRFLEEAIELYQSANRTRSDAHQLVDYVFDRPIGEKPQEVGGVMLTLAAFCLAHKLDMHQCGEVELARVWTKVEQIRVKQAAKPKDSPLPVHVAAGGWL